MVWMMVLWGSSALAEAEKRKENPIFMLNRQLPQAVCDESTASQAPLLVTSSLRKSPDSAFNETRFQVSIQASESDLLRSLFADPTALLSAWGDDTPAGQISEQKRKISLEICQAVVTPGKLEPLLKKHPQWFLQTFFQSKKPQKGKIHLVLQDRERRFGQIGARWYVGGWIEGYEIQEARSFWRHYLRLSQPITHETRSILLMTSLQGVDLPIGYFYPRSSKGVFSFQSALSRSKSPQNQKKLVDTYRVFIERDSYEILSKRPDQVEAVRKLQDFYRNILNAYEIFPGDDRFTGLGKAENHQIPLSRVRQTLGPDFISRLREIRLNQRGYLGFDLFDPQSRLHGIYLEFLSRIRTL